MRTDLDIHDLAGRGMIVFGVIVVAGIFLTLFYANGCQNWIH